MAKYLATHAASAVLSSQRPSSSPLLRRCFSSRDPRLTPAAKRPGYSIPAQGIVFTLLLFPVLAYAVYADKYGPSDEQLEAEIRQRYAGKIAENAQKKEAMAEFFQRAILQPDGTVDERLKQVLYAGKGGKKRMGAVDEKLYGTAEGVEEKKRQEEEQKKREEYRRKKKAGEIVEEKPKDAKSNDALESPEVLPPPSNGGIVLNTQSAATLGAVALLAAGVGFLAGGSRRS
eukprot:scaffold3195_cov162-Amphora_coffeaeformis.AAC.7